MSYSLSKIDPTLTEEKLRKHVEGQYFDRKSARLNQKELARHISAFANANGGVVALGIEDNGDVTARITNFIAYEENGKQYPAYCLDIDLPGVDEMDGYGVTAEDMANIKNNQAVWRVLLNGYPYKSAEEMLYPIFSNEMIFSSLINI